MLFYITLLSMKKNITLFVLFPGGGTDSEKSDVGKRVKDQVFATIALKKAGSKNEVSTVTHIYQALCVKGYFYYDPIDKNLFLELMH